MHEDSDETIELMLRHTVIEHKNGTPLPAKWQPRGLLDEIERLRIWSSDWARKSNSYETALQDIIMQTLDPEISANHWERLGTISEIAYKALTNEEG